jgi:adenylate cyclase
MARELQSFIFTDLIGFTALTAEQGDDRAADVALELRARVGGLLTEFGAEEIKAIGDGLMLRAGDPADAIRLGVQIVSELDHVPGFPPVRVGVHAGPAVARAGDWYGNTVNVAARLCAAAGAGEVLTSEAAVRAAGRMRGLELGERKLHWLKNVTEPVPAHSVGVHACKVRTGWLRRVPAAGFPGARQLGPEVRW